MRGQAPADPQDAAEWSSSSAARRRRSDGDARERRCREVRRRRLAGRSQHGDPIGAVPERSAEAGRSQYDHWMGTRPVERFHGVDGWEAEVGEQAQCVAGVRTIGLERVRRPRRPLLPGNRRQHARRWLGARGAHVQPQERARAEGQRRQPFSGATLAVERRGLVAEHRLERRLEPDRSAGREKTDVVRRSYLGEHSCRHAEKLEELTIPPQRRQVDQEGAAGVRGLVTCSAPPEKCQASQHAMSPKKSSPASARLRNVLSRSKSHPSFGAEKVESSPRPVSARTAAASGRPANAWHHMSARWSCQLTTGVAGCPVARSQRTNDSVWLAIPIPATSPSPCATTSETASSAPPSSASGSCSTIPGAGRLIATAREAAPRRRRCRSYATQRVLELP